MVPDRTTHHIWLVIICWSYLAYMRYWYAILCQIETNSGWAFLIWNSQTEKFKVFSHRPKTNKAYPSNLSLLATIKCTKCETLNCEVNIPISLRLLLVAFSNNILIKCSFLCIKERFTCLKWVVENGST